ncbi:NAD-glutamate dehydrogenase [Vibrio sp. SM6]|uniref:NAD-glutamate dehydrogenase n=1 Tax=Vibrio agarilyticus TaxID=2726741 RepID=A0A7X8TQT6_9VIBR|nr:NAD-glutamate dehydrogenase [Vibrio agarilyticus]NLS12553.1 NAD-glutamate dehydrogenase [Vibrio agarilyticus]
MSQPRTVVPVLLDKVYQRIQAKFESSQCALLLSLAKRLFSNVSEEDLLARDPADLYGAVVSLWQRLAMHKADDISVSVFNPDVTHQGWQSNHTVIEIVIKDSPFLVDSIKMALSRLGLTTHLMLSNPVRIKRNKQDSIIEIGRDKGETLSLFHLEVDCLSDAQEMNNLKNELLCVLNDTRLVVSDWQPMVDKLKSITTNLSALPCNNEGIEERRKETIAFLNWMTKHNFTFMGYKEFDLVGKGDAKELVPTKTAGLGLFAQTSHVHKVKLSELSTAARLEIQKDEILVLTKGNQASRIHRPAYYDYVGIKKYDEKGRVCGEHRFTGLYTSAVYNQTVANIPLVRDKVNRILDTSGYLKGSYAFKALHNILENYPRDELLQASEEALLDVGKGVVQMQDRDMLRLFVRRDPFGRFFSAMVYVTKERYNTQLRRQTQKIFQTHFGSDKAVEFTTFFSESSLARTHYIVRVENNEQTIDVKAIESDLIEAASTWSDRLKHSLMAHQGESLGIKLFKQYQNSFSHSYQHDVMPSSAVADIDQLQHLDDVNRLGMLFYRPQELTSHSQSVHLKLYHRDDPLHLSDVMPILENLGLRIIGESPYEIRRTDGQVFWILDFSMLRNRDHSFDLDEARERLQDAFAAIWYRKLENDGFNRLILATKLTGREVVILRSYARYMRQVGFPFSQQYIENTLANHANLAESLVELFKVRFNPRSSNRDDRQQSLISLLDDQLKKVESLDDDRIVRRYMDMILATQRTNYFQTNESNEPKAWLSLKLAPTKIPEMPLPILNHEIFVYATDVEGVHLRGGKIARGGLRWSDRQEDFRTEILGLVKAQQVKNTVIVPVGAKGGFVCKHQAKFEERNALLAEGQRCYQIFIRGLLDVSDNIVEEKVVSPPNCICHDDDDPYLVVAADKGTATFSDLANLVAADYQFWLDDGFASGGSNGYDHKAMGITAKGAWESVKRHFREMGVNCQEDAITVVGIGDMAGDVFGNGMLLSKTIHLQAAFNHQHIFIDPTPNAKTSWKERERLFYQTGSNWEDYDRLLISKGGGIFSRRAKSIDLSPEIQRLIGTDAQRLTPNDLIKAILKLPVDLLWNGGIGTYVKACTEDHLQVGDRANDALRINGNELNAKVVGEGGNLGMTQLARIEFALRGGRVNTDFVDNVGGVDCSDNEVNIKILLNQRVSASDLTLKQRNQLLERMQDEVSTLVLSHAYQQAESISVTESLGVKPTKEHIRFIHGLEKTGLLDRALEGLPNDESLYEREKKGLGLTRPELAVLTAYAKMALKQTVMEPLIVDDPFHQRQLEHYFPSELRGNFERYMLEHPLCSEIIATSVANQIVNEMGANFVSRLQEETGSSSAEVANAYCAAREIFSVGVLYQEIRGLDNHAQCDAQYHLFLLLRQTLRRLTRWLIRNRFAKQSVDTLVAKFKPSVEALQQCLENVISKEEQAECEDLMLKWVELGITDSLAKQVSLLPALQSAFDISTVATELKQTIVTTARAYFYLGQRLDLYWFMQQINTQAVENYWQASARAAFREDLEWQQRQLTQQALKCTECGHDNVINSLNQWLSRNQSSTERWTNILNEFKVGTAHEFAKFSVALRELLLLNLNCSSNE